ncbi:glycoside hydrolase family 95-like protein [Streptomyces sp. NY05-11A]|uniref:glycoside hydrolase family 95-like protein n=1 Tax=Streptomyces soliscabiei TaxID=588897 RepID=UPI0029B98521|nr:hypothetical protein [Streptomyces sp. NY05-11A]MDX2682644.1 hypothetical protein [Streptomyces sp. NY05-11A]
MTTTPGNRISRRGAIGTAAAVAAGGWSIGSGTAWAASPSSGGATDLYERMARAAALRWRRMPGDWKDGPFLGNGLLGVQVYRGATANSVKVKGGNLAVESPLTAAQSVLDMAVQSHGDVVRVFPSVSRRWPDLSVQGLRAQGAFLVDADRSGGRTRWVRVHSEAGAPLQLQHGIDGAIDVRDERGRRLKYRETGAGRVRIQLGRNDTAVVLPRGTHPDLAPRDVPAVGDAKPWGLPD